MVGGMVGGMVAGNRERQEHPMSTRSAALEPPPAASPAQIALPALSPPLLARRLAMATALRFGAALASALGVFAVAALVADGERVTVWVLPALWLGAGAFGFLAALAARRDEAPSARRVKLSWALFTGMLALVAPVSVQAPFAPWVWAPFIEDTSFAGWLGWSAVLVGHTHVVFAAMCARAGFRAASGRETRLLPIWCAAVAVTSLDCLLWGRFGVLPMAYVAVTAVPVLILIRRVLVLARAERARVAHLPLAVSRG
jgi:hypothetical protein